MLKNQIHPASIRSKQYIVNSLLDLMKKFPYKNISIKDITEKAELTRRTFYAHFKTKDDVLQYRLDELNKELITIITNLKNDNPQSIALSYFEFWMKHAQLLKLMRKHQLLPLLFHSFDENIREIRLIFGCELYGSNKQYSDYSSAFFAGILSNILDKWIENDIKESPEELVQILVLITQKFSSSFLAYQP